MEGPGHSALETCRAQLSALPSHSNSQTLSDSIRAPAIDHFECQSSNTFETSRLAIQKKKKQYTRLDI